MLHQTALLQSQGEIVAFYLIITAMQMWKLKWIVKLSLAIYTGNTIHITLRFYESNMQVINQRSCSARKGVIIFFIMSLQMLGKFCEHWHHDLEKKEGDYQVCYKLQEYLGWLLELVIQSCMQPEIQATNIKENWTYFHLRTKSVPNPKPQ